MERLTIKNWRNLDPWETCGQDNYCKRGCHDQGGCTKGCIVPRIYARLAAYEDTGLEPEEIKVHEAAKYNAGYYHGDEDRCRWIEKELGPIDHLRDLLQAEQEGRLVVLPCKVGEYWRDRDGERVRIESVSFSFTRRHLCNTDMVTYRYDDEEDDFAVNWIYFKSHFTREEAEAALALKGGESDA